MAQWSILTAEWITLGSPYYYYENRRYEDDNIITITIS